MNELNIGGGIPNLGKPAQTDLSKTTALECKCGGQYFAPALHFRKSSRLATGATEDEVTPVEVYLCIDCGDVFDELLPKGLRADDDETTETPSSIIV